MPMPKMVWSCNDCGTVLHLWQVRCPNCRKSGMSLLQVAVIAILIVPAVFFVIKILS
jgi:predicted ATP-dependent serine protease